MGWRRREGGAGGRDATRVSSGSLSGMSCYEQFLTGDGLAQVVIQGVGISGVVCVFSSPCPSLLVELSCALL